MEKLSTRTSTDGVGVGEYLWEVAGEVVAVWELWGKRQENRAAGFEGGLCSVNSTQLCSGAAHGRADQRYTC